MEIIHTDSSIEIRYDSGTQILFCDWDGFQSKEAIQFASGIILDQIKQKNIRKVLNNHEQVTGPWIDASDWMKDEWFPAVFDAGVVYFAWVQSVNPFAALASSKAIPPDSIVHEFETPSSALTWLMEQT